MLDQDASLHGMQAMPLCRSTTGRNDGRRQQSGQFSGNGSGYCRTTVIMDGLRTLTPDIPVLSEEILPVGKSVSTGSVTGW